MTRFRNWVQANGWWSDEEETELRGTLRKQVGFPVALNHTTMFYESISTDGFYQVLKAIQVAEKTEKPSLGNLFSDVYDKVPSNLQEQEKSLRQTIKTHKQDFPADVPL